MVNEDVEQVLGGYVLRDYSDAFPFVLMLLVIALRPQGLFGSRLRQDVMA